MSDHAGFLCSADGVVRGPEAGARAERPDTPARGPLRPRRGGAARAAMAADGARLRGGADRARRLCRVGRRQPRRPRHSRPQGDRGAGDAARGARGLPLSRRAARGPGKQDRRPARRRRLCVGKATHSAPGSREIRLFRTRLGAISLRRDFQRRARPTPSAKAPISKLFMQVFARKSLFSPNFRKHFFGGFELFQ